MIGIYLSPGKTPSSCTHSHTHLHNLTGRCWQAFLSFRASLVVKAALQTRVWTFLPMNTRQIRVLQNLCEPVRYTSLGEFPGNFYMPPDKTHWPPDPDRYHNINLSWPPSLLRGPHPSHATIQDCSPSYELLRHLSVLSMGCLTLQIIATVFLPIPCSSPIHPCLSAFKLQLAPTGAGIFLAWPWTSFP